MEKQSKITTVSVRVEEDLMRRFDTVTEITSVNKSDFIRACLQKFCDDNQMLIDHFSKVGEYIDFIKNELSKLPADLIVVENGAWEDVPEWVVLILCDGLWRASKPVFANWLELLETYNLEREDQPNDFSEAERSDGLLNLDSFIMLSAERSGHVASPDIPLLISEENWIEDVEADRISLSYACKKAFETATARKVLQDYLYSEAMKKQESPLRVIVDARGAFRRSGSVLYLPIGTEKITEDETIR